MFNSITCRLLAKHVVGKRVTRVGGMPTFHNSAHAHKLVHFNLADIGEGIQECEIVSWFIKPGDQIHQFDKICEVQSDKASVEITSRFDGIVKKLHHEVGEMAKVGKPLIDIDVPDSHPAEPVASPATPSTPATPATPAPNAPITTTQPVKLTPRQEEIMSLATPAVRRVAKENGIDIRQITGTGKEGRVLKSDIEQFIATGPAQPTQSAQPAVGKDVKEVLTPLQKSMFKNMTKSLQIPHLLYTEQVFLDSVVKLRKEINAGLPQNGPVSKITYMPILLKAFSLALSRYPILNAILVDIDTAPAVQYRASHNIGVAMDTPQGLIVPIIKNVQSRSILDIAQELNRLQGLGQKNAIPPADFKDGTVALSNIGNVGGLAVGPVIPPNTVCIGGFGKIQKVAAVVEQDAEDVLVVKHAMIVSFSADHRVIDGATIARCVTLFKQYLENPGLLLSELK